MRIAEDGERARVRIVDDIDLHEININIIKSYRYLCDLQKHMSLQVGD